MNLKEWAHIFLKQRDIIKKEISSIEEDEEGFIITTKTGEKRKAIVKKELELKEGAQHIICLNTKKNVETLITKWEAFAKEEQLLIVFSKPQTNEKWLVKPYHHDKISDKESLKQGLLSMYDAIGAA